jgi:hypothetical protein
MKRIITSLAEFEGVKPENVQITGTKYAEWRAQLKGKMTHLNLQGLKSKDLSQKSNKEEETKEKSEETLK